MIEFIGKAERARIGVDVEIIQRPKCLLRAEHDFDERKSQNEIDRHDQDGAVDPLPQRLRRRGG